MPKGRAFNCDFRFSLFFLSYAKSIGCKRRTIEFPSPLDRVLLLARNRHRPTSNGFIERAPE
ncbi:hypothetical protein Q8G39_28470, partial [Klebsiella pneumoniae]|uniref:hypothetical protein n=1 Tax=Klebsiella pneumoniae TaxID=573 RepID=UPI003013DEE4